MINWLINWFSMIHDSSFTEAPKERPPGHWRSKGRPSASTEPAGEKAGQTFFPNMKITSFLLFLMCILWKKWNKQNWLVCMMWKNETDQ